MIAALIMAVATTYCPLESAGVLWSNGPGVFSIYVSNPTKSAIPIDYADITTGVMDNENGITQRTVHRIHLTAAIAKPLGMTSINFVDPSINPDLVINSDVECKWKSI